MNLKEWRQRFEEAVARNGQGETPAEVFDAYVADYRDKYDRLTVGELAAFARFGAEMEQQLRIVEYPPPSGRNI